MSSTELARFKKRLREAQNQLSTLTLPLWNLAGFRQLKGEVLGRNGLSIEGLEVLTNLGQRAVTDSEGCFTFNLIGRQVSLTLRWRGVELKNWVTIELKVGEPTEIKIKWPHLVRGQVLTEGDQGLMGIQVTLNHLYQTQTDLFGAFTFPLLDGELSELDHFIFEIYGKQYVHHFRASVGQSPLRLFYYQDQELYHVKNLTRLNPIKAIVPTQSQQLKMASLASIIVLLIMIFSAMIPSSPPPIPPLPATLMLNPALSAGPTDHPVDQVPALDFATSSQDLDFDSESMPVHECDQIEFLYYQYRVPRGMEGFLLSILFGSWQQWKDDLDLLNEITEDRQLQAGQFIKLKLPFQEWRLFTLYKDEGAQELRDALKCDEANIVYCLKVVQIWNPHLDVRFLRRGDRLLINQNFLNHPRWGEDINRRIDLLKRSRGRRHAKPRLKIPKGCVLYPLRPEVAERVRQQEEAEKLAQEREREAKRLERERRREAQRLEQEAKRRARERRNR